MEINKKTLEICKQYSINRDILGSCLFVLKCFNDENYELLDIFDDTNTNKNALIVYKNLEKLKFLKQEKSEDKTIHYKLTTLGKIFINSINNDIIEVIKPTSDLSWVQEYINLFKDERNIFLKSGNRTLGSNLRDVSHNMKKFLERYSYLFKNLEEKQIILTATKNYLTNQKKNNYKYCQDCFYFIMKQDGTSKVLKSALASECENVINNNVIIVEQQERDKSVN